jgi:molybdenum cofactor cytidylyltransferase
MSETGAAGAAFVLLAAGNSVRMGAPKQLLDYRGQPLLRHAAAAALASGCRPIVVVLGAREQELRDVLAGLPVEIAVNERWADGLGTSIQTGIRVIEGRSDVSGAVLGLADQPQVTPEFLRGLIASHTGSGTMIVASRYSGTVGVPAYFAREAFPLLMALAPDKGCKGVILGSASVLLVDCPDAAMDIDTPDDYRRASR